MIGLVLLGRSRGTNSTKKPGNIAVGYTLLSGESGCWAASLKPSNPTCAISRPKCFWQGDAMELAAVLLGP